MNPSTVAGIQRVIACDAHTLMQSREEAEMGDFFSVTAPQFQTREVDRTICVA